MKTMKTNTIAKLFAMITIAFFTTNAINAQFEGSAQVDQTAIEERKGEISTYTIPGDATDEYSWQVVGGTVVVPAAGVTGAGSAGDPFVVPFTVGLQSIQVQWPADDNTITSIATNVSVQKKVLHASVDCPSAIQSMDIALWSNPTIAIQDADYEICNGDATLGDVTVEFTGALNFDYKYTITDLDGSVGTDQVVTGVAGGTSTISIPATLVNTSSTLDQTYIVTITEMNDSFTGVGTINDASFTITVHPTVETGDIVSDKTLTRR